MQIVRPDEPLALRTHRRGGPHAHAGGPARRTLAAGPQLSVFGINALTVYDVSVRSLTRAFLQVRRRASVPCDSSMSGFASLRILHLSMRPLGKADWSHILARLERLRTLLDRLDQMTSDTSGRRQVRQLMRHELVATRNAVKKLATPDLRVGRVIKRRRRRDTVRSAD